MTNEILTTEIADGNAFITENEELVLNKSVLNSCSVYRRLSQDPQDSIRRALRIYLIVIKLLSFAPLEQA